MLKEAGEHCSRDGNPFQYGMELNKIAHCTVPDVFKTTKLPTHKYSEVATIRSTLESSSRPPVIHQSTQTPQTRNGDASTRRDNFPLNVTDRNSVRYSVTNTNVPKQSAPPVKKIERRPPIPVTAGANRHLAHINYLLMLLIPFHLCYFSL
jgi:hypothetical protein